MRIAVQQRGGFAGVEIDLGVVDTDRASEQEADQLRGLLGTLGLFDTEASHAGDQVGADFVTYRITVTDGDRRRSVELRDDGSQATAPLRALVNLVSAASSTRPTDPRP